MKPIKQPQSFMKPPSTHHRDKWNPYLKPIKQPMPFVKAPSLRLRHCWQTQTIPKIHQHKNHPITKSTIIRPTKSSSTTIRPPETKLNNLRWMVLKGDFRSWRIGSNSVGSRATSGLSLVGVVVGLIGLAEERVWERERRIEKKREIGSGAREWAFCKMFYHWFFGKIFYKFLCTNFGQIENILQLWLYFTCKQTLENRKILRKIFYFEINRAKSLRGCLVFGVSITHHSECWDPWREACLDLFSKFFFHHSILWFLSDELWKLKTHFRCFQVMETKLWWHFGNFLRSTWAHGKELSNPPQNFCSLQHSTQRLLLTCLSPSHKSHWRANPLVHFFRATSPTLNPSQPYFFFSNLTPHSWPYFSDSSFTLPTATHLTKKISNTAQPQALWTLVKMGSMSLGLHESYWWVSSTWRME